MDTEFQKEVDFSTYCKTCKHKDLDEGETPCNECLSEPGRYYTRKPLYWEEKK